eukprot:CAMPEP_0181234594 /NCGR_PEP_ID=MMETSP1096-20121128/37068_1 /TAXON_ID=156174 ORGANISM="Chrysochromulina ericina, Strain CCMP281" /NCGR_SAMPLE_ID=MMETSP1096 /ASSEMBLY_ACC=CAM_ASM_000453 /LENGTH=85 /DNA_ID=CAMNT_0023329403 /DNA_START=413 /DNA_END=668 /DNA_ORIENTATION=-
MSLIAGFVPSAERLKPQVEHTPWRAGDRLEHRLKGCSGEVQITYCHEHIADQDARPLSIRITLDSSDNNAAQFFFIERLQREAEW